MTETHQATPPKSPDGDSAAKKASHEGPFDLNVAVLVSVLIHLFALIVLAMAAMLKPHRPSTVPIFELVNVEQPKLRPLEPKTLPPPEPPPPPPPEPVKAPEAPKLTPKPTKAVNTKKPEPKVVKPPDEEKIPEKEVVHEQQVLQPQIVSHMPADPRLSFWASRVKKKAETLWNPPTGIDILGDAKTVVSFKVMRDGRVLEPKVETSSGNSDLDDLALRTIQRMEQVPPIPENYDKDEIEVTYEFVYKGQ